MIYDIIIIGAGPAGLTACLYALRSKLNVLLLDKSAAGGYLGQIQELENYPGFENPISGYDLADQMVRQLKNYNYQFKQAEVKNIEKSQTDNQWKIILEKESLLCRSVILATGTSPKKLGIKGESEFTGRGVSYCAVCDAPFFKNKNVAVIGGGNSAVEEAIYLTKFASKVSIVHRREQLRADKILQEKAEANEKIELLLNKICTKITGTTAVEQMVIEDVQTKETNSVDVQGIFIFIGMDPLTGFIGSMLEKNDKGYFINKADMSSSVDGIFVCGDCRDGPLRQVITACADGAIAATSARKYLE